nr:putative E3 ubiquitin-protein ligase LIN [Tanacetum cinerariifolium]
MLTLRRLLPHARGLGFKPRRGGFPSGAKKEWGLSPKAKVRVLHTAQLDVTPIWTDEGQQSIEINRNKTLSKFPSFFPERVSPRVFTNQRSSSRLSRLEPNNKDPESEPEDNSSCMSSSDSDL